MNDEAARRKRNDEMNFVKQVNLNHFSRQSFNVESGLRGGSRIRVRAYNLLYASKLFRKSMGEILSHHRRVATGALE